MGKLCSCIFIYLFILGGLYIILGPPFVCWVFVIHVDLCSSLQYAMFDLSHPWGEATSTDKAGQFLAIRILARRTKIDNPVLPVQYFSLSIWREWWLFLCYASSRAEMSHIIDISNYCICQTTLFWPFYFFTERQYVYVIVFVKIAFPNFIQPMKIKNNNKYEKKLLITFVFKFDQKSSWNLNFRWIKW